MNNIKIGDMIIHKDKLYYLLVLRILKNNKALVYYSRTSVSSEIHLKLTSGESKI